MTTAPFSPNLEYLHEFKMFVYIYCRPCISALSTYAWLMEKVLKMEYKIITHVYQCTCKNVIFAIPTAGKHLKLEECNGCQWSIKKYLLIYRTLDSLTSCLTLPLNPEKCGHIWLPFSVWNYTKLFNLFRYFFLGTILKKSQC